MKRLNGFSTIVMSCLAACSLTGAAAAAEGGTYEMGAYTNEPGGSDIVKGDYAAAIAAAVHVPTYNSERSLIAATNLCVAYTVTRSFEKAAPTCDRALSLAMAADSSVRRAGSTHEATIRALTNRGVLRAVRGDATGAAHDFRAAADLRGAWQAPSRNLAYLQAVAADRVARAGSATD